MVKINKRKPIKDNSILVVGVVRDCEKYLVDDLNSIRNSLVNFKKIEFLIIESDSQDGTVDLLFELSSKIELKHYSLGSLSIEQKIRTKRIEIARNYYLDIIRGLSVYPDFVLIADLDGMNTDVSIEGIESCWNLEQDWDACFAIQDGPYYDIWALRHPLWSPSDCWLQANYLKQLGMNKSAADYIAVHSKRLNLRSYKEPIQVLSAFGGLGIYKYECLLVGQYEGISPTNFPVCEHEKFHESLINESKNLFINPFMINGGAGYDQKRMLWPSFTPDLY